MVIRAAGEQQFAASVLLFLGIFSLAIAAIFTLRQRDFKRLLAYSSVEHMGIIAIGTGLGGVASKMAFFHALNHALITAALFLVAGNIMKRVKTKSICQTSGLLRILPISGMLWMVGILAIAGMPPFGMFISKFFMFRQAFSSGNVAVGISMLLFLGLIFIGLTTAVAKMAFGLGDKVKSFPGFAFKEPVWSIIPPIVLLMLSLLLGIYVPTFLSTLLEQVVHE